MRTPEEVFNDIFAVYGGRLHPLPTHLALSLEIHRKRMYYWITRVKSVAESSSMPGIYIDYIANGSLNAVASENEGLGYIGINWGDIIILGDLFCRMLSHPRVMKSIGNVAEEFLDPVFQDGVNLNGDDLQKRRWPTGCPQENQIWAAMPKDLIRLHSAEICRMIALDFLCLHELAHVGYGHIAYYKDKFAIPFLLEIDSSTHPPDLQMTRQALELNADAFAASVSLNSFLSNRRHLLESIPELKPLMSDKVAVFLWGFAIASLFYVFEPSFDVDSLPSLTHLPASIRSEGNVKCGLDAATEAHPSIKELNKMEMLDLRHVCHAFECIGFKWPIENILRYEACRNTKRLDEHVQGVISRFNSLKPELKLYSYFDIEKGRPAL